MAKTSFSSGDVPNIPGIKRIDQQYPQDLGLTQAASPSPHHDQYLMQDLSSKVDSGDEALKIKNYHDALKFFDQALRLDPQPAINSQALPLLVYSSAMCLSLASLLEKHTEKTNYQQVQNSYIERALSSDINIKKTVNLPLTNVLLMLPGILGTSSEKIILDIQRTLSNKAENVAEEKSIGDIWDAIDRGSSEEVLKFIGQVNKKYIVDGRSIYPIHIATDLGNADITKLLISNGANVNAITTSRDTPLHFAARYEDESFIQLLLDNGGDIYRMNEFKDRPIDCALVRGRVEVFKILLEREEDQSVSKLSTFLSKARKGGDIALFLQSKIDEERDKGKAFRAERKKAEKEAKLKAENYKKLEEEAKAQKAAQAAKLKAEAEAKILEEAAKAKGKKHKVNLEKQEAAAAERRKLEEKQKAKLELKAKLEAEAKEKADQTAKAKQEKANKEFEDKLKAEAVIKAAKEQARIEANEKRLLAEEAKKVAQAQVEEKAKLVNESSFEMENEALKLQRAQEDENRASDNLNFRLEEKADDEEGSIHKIHNITPIEKVTISSDLSPLSQLDYDTPTASTDAESISSNGTAGSRFTTKSYSSKTGKGWQNCDVPTDVEKMIFDAGHRVGMGTAYKRMKDQKQLHNQKLAQSGEQNHHVTQDSYFVFVAESPIETRKIVYISAKNHTHDLGIVDESCMMCIMGGAFVPDPIE